LGPQASEKTGALVHAMQARAFELQLVADTAGPVVPDEIDLARIRAPALIVAGALDLDYFRSVASHLAASLRRARLVTLDWAAHLPSLERPDDVTSLVLAFLSERQASVG
jgi:3-oxoadipate enol-lactonase